MTTDYNSATMSLADLLSRKVSTIDRRVGSKRGADRPARMAGMWTIAWHIRPVDDDRAGRYCARRSSDRCDLAGGSGHVRQDPCMHPGVS